VHEIVESKTKYKIMTGEFLLRLTVRLTKRNNWKIRVYGKVNCNKSKVMVHNFSFD
jgi:hypothetical protein